MNPAERFVIPDEVMAREVGEELVLLDLASGIYFGLDPVGARIWQLMAQGLTAAGICDTLVQEYEVKLEDCERDLAALAVKLHSHGLIKASP